MMVLKYLAIAIALMGTVGTASAGNEFIVNTKKPHEQLYPSAARLANGKIVVVWDEELWPNGSGQILKRDGTKSGVQFGLSNQKDVPIFRPSVVATKAGFVALGTTLGRFVGFEGILGVRFDSTGKQLGAPFPIRSDVTQSDPIGVSNSIRLLVVWEEMDKNTKRETIYGRFFDHGGNPKSGSFRVAPVNTRWQRFPSVTITPGGSFVVAWSSCQTRYTVHNNSCQLLAQVYGPTGTKLARKNLVKKNKAYLSSVTLRALPIGEFALAWEDYGNGIMGQRFNNALTPIGSAFHVSSTSGTIDYSLFPPAIAAGKDNSFTVVYESGFDSDAIKARGFTRDGIAVGEPYAVSQRARGMKAHLSVVDGSSSDDFFAFWYFSPSFSGSSEIYGRHIEK